MQYQHALFDLDGTLIRSEDGILNSVEYALAKMGRQSPGRDFLLRFIGPPLVESFEKLCGLSAKDAQRATELYRERYSQTGLYECALYTGIRQLLQDLSEAGCHIHLATGKPEAYARPILEHLLILPHFTVVAGIPLDLQHHSKESLIRRVMEEAHFAPAAGVMVGDRYHDVEGAAACGMDCIGVLYGYGDAAELATAGATYLAHNAAEVGRYILG